MASAIFNNMEAFKTPWVGSFWLTDIILRIVSEAGAGTAQKWKCVLTWSTQISQIHSSLFSLPHRPWYIDIGLFQTQSYHCKANRPAETTVTNYVPLYMKFSAVKAKSAHRRARGWTAGVRFTTWQDTCIFLFSTPSRLALGPAQPSVQWVPGDLPPG
jgi:hypothetical protein